jgi:hypothetical protein
MWILSVLLLGLPLASSSKFQGRFGYEQHASSQAIVDRELEGFEWNEQNITASILSVIAIYDNVLPICPADPENSDQKATLNKLLEGRRHLFRAAIEEKWLSTILESNPYVAYGFFEMLCKILFSNLSEFEKELGRNAKVAQDVNEVIIPIMAIVNTVIGSWPHSRLAQHFCTSKFVVQASQLLQSPIEEERTLVTDMFCKSLQSLKTHAKFILQEYAETVLQQVGLALYDAGENPGEISRRPLKHAFELYNCCKDHVAPPLLMKFVRNYVVPFLRKLHCVDFQANATSLLITTINQLQRTAKDCYSVISTRG